MDRHLDTGKGMGKAMSWGGRHNMYLEDTE